MAVLDMYTGWIHVSGRFLMRLGFFLVVGLWLAVFAAAADAQTLLLTSDSSSPIDIVSAQTYSGVAETTARQVEPSSDIVVCLLMDTLSPGELTSFKPAIAALYKAAGRTRPVSLVLLSGNAVQTAGPFKNAAALEAAFAEISQAAPPEAAPAGAALYWTIAAAASKIGATNWTSLVLVGHPPPVAPQLEDYLVAHLLQSLGSRKLRVSFWGGGVTPPAFLATICGLTGGAVLGGGLATPPLISAPPLPSYFEVSWPSPQLKRGFRLYRAALLRGAGTTVVEVPWLGAAPDAELPGPERYLTSREPIEEANVLLRNVDLTQEQVGRLRTGLQEVLSVNPSDIPGLRLSVDFHKRYREYKAAAQDLSWLMELEPNNRDLLADYGHSSFLAGDLDAAEKALVEARRLQLNSPIVAEDLARIRVARNDLAGALPFLEESLGRSPKNLDLWLMRTDASRKIGDWVRLADSLEHVTELDSRDLSKRTELVTIYLAHDMKEKAFQHIQTVMASPPPDTATRVTYALFLEQLNRPDEVLRAWRMALETDPGLEQAHYRVSRLLLDKGDAVGAMFAAEAGLAVAGKSARLHLVRIEILEKQGAIREVRKSLRKAAAGIENVALLRRRAEVEDIFGPSAPGAFRSLAEAAGRSGAAPEDRLSILERGLYVSLREGEKDTAAWFGAQLSAAGRKEFSAGLGSDRESGTGDTSVPGGLAALMFIAQGKERPTAETVLSDYCRAVLGGLGRQAELVGTYKKTLTEHFERMRSLEPLGKSEGGVLRIELNVAQKEGQRQAERVLNLLGWKLRVSGTTVQVVPGEQQSHAKRQETLSALAIDGVAMQEALQSWKPYTIEIPYEQAKVVLGEAAWRNAFYAKENLAGGFFEAVLRDPRIGQVYVGLAKVDSNTLAILNESFGLKRLAERYPTLLQLYASGLSVVDQRVVVPGGRSAEAVWKSLTGVGPEQPAQFLRALLEKDDGKVLAFFLTLSQLDSARQKFFTFNQARLGRFYELFSQSPEMRLGPDRLARETSFIEFLRDIPLDGNGRVRFPGGPEVWMVARGQSSSEAATARLLKKVDRVANPDVEDEILLRLARTRYKTGAERYTELDNFIAVARIDGHRAEPLEEAAALRLAQRFAQHESFYPYFAILTGLMDGDFQKFSAFSDKLRSLDGPALNTVVGQFHALVAVLCLGQQSQALGAKEAADLFRLLCERFGAATDEADYTNASLDAVRQIIAGMPAELRDPDPDKAIQGLLLGNTKPVAVEVDDRLLNLDPAAKRRADYLRVLEQQKVTSLRALFEIQEAARALLAGAPPTIEPVNTIEKRLPELLFVGVPKELGVTGKQREDLLSFQPRDAAEIGARLRSEVSKRKVNPKQVANLVRQLLGGIEPQVRVALSGVVYAYYLRPDDLLVSEDALLLRKHQFIQLERRGGNDPAFMESEFHVSDSKGGSYFEGGFASFTKPLGRAGLFSGRGGADSAFVAMSQLSTLRATEWRLLQDQDLRVFALTVSAAREWVVRSAFEARLRSDLAEDTFGLLSLSRRADLLRGLTAADWPSVWDAVTLSDLYFLGVRFLSRYEKDPFASPVVRELRRVSTPEASLRLQSLGASQPELLGCGHAHLTLIGPYEEFERHMFPSRVAERTAEFKLYLAQIADRAGIPAATLGLAAERLAAEALKKMDMADVRDWRSALKAFSAIDEKQLVEALSSQ